MSNWWNDDPGADAAAGGAGPDQPTTGAHAPPPIPRSQPQGDGPDQPTISNQAPPTVAPSEDAATGRHEIMTVAGIGFLLLFVVLVTFAPVANYRDSLATESRSVRLSDIEISNARTWLTISLIAAAASALAGFFSLRWQRLTSTALLLGIASLWLCAMAILGTGDGEVWLGRWEGDSITVALLVAVIALSVGLALLLGSLTYSPAAIDIGSPAVIAAALVLAGGIYVVVAAPTASDAEDFLINSGGATVALAEFIGGA